MITGLHIIEKNISSKISEKLDSVGILYRIFTRSKDPKSILEKIKRKELEGRPYTHDDKKMQDIIGVRIVTYFQDDINIVKEILSNLFQFIDEEIDTPKPTVFEPKRTNIIYAFKEEDVKTFSAITSNEIDFQLCDKTFELQLRTILSEGWHEIDHSLRYKCKSDWDSHSEKERLLNGIYANLEVNDLALKALFSELSYNHFKEKNWEAMIRNKFRLKFQQITLSQKLIDIFDQDTDLAKQFLKVDRDLVIKRISKLDFSLPITFNHLIYLINYLEIKNESIDKIIPQFIKDNFE